MTNKSEKNQTLTSMKTSNSRGFGTEWSLKIEAAIWGGEENIPPYIKQEILNPKLKGGEST